MSQNSHILQRVYEEADILDLGEDIAKTQVWGVDMRANSTGYELITSVAQRDRYRSYGALTIAVKADGGIFSNNSPHAVEISSNEKLGAMTLRVDSIEVGDDGGAKIRTTTEKPPKRERLLLPGDKGFAIFEELHEEVKHIGGRVSSVADMLEVGPATAFGMSPQGSSGYQKPGSPIRHYHRMDYFEFGASQTSPEHPHMVELVMDTIGPAGGERPKYILYTSGALHKVDNSGRKAYWREGPVVHFNNRPSKELDFEDLMAFSAIGTLVQDLAPKNPYI